MTESTTENPTPKHKLTKMGVAHGVVRFAAATSVKMIVGTAIAQIVPTETKADKAKVIVGTYVISGIVSDAAKTYASNELNDFVEMASILKHKLKGDLAEAKSDNPDQ